MNRKTVFYFLLTCTLICPALMPASDPAELAGYWQGTIELPGVKLEIQLSFQVQEDGSFKGEISIPAQNARNLPLSAVTRQEGETSFSITGVPGEPAFRGVLSEDGLSFSGEFSQGGAVFPFSLQRSTDPGVEAAEALAEFSEIVERGLKELNVPGVALAVVKDGQVILAEGYGLRDLEVKVTRGKLSFIYNDIETPLEHWHYDTFNGIQAEDLTFRDFKINFGRAVSGRVAWLEAQLEPTLDPLRLVKKAPARFSDPAYLQQFTGRYELPGQVIEVSLKGSALSLVLPGQPEFDLLPQPDEDFVLKQAKIVRIRFLEDKDGRVSGLELNQSGAVFTAKRLD